MFAPFSKTCRFFCDCFCQYKLLGFVDQYDLKMFMIFISQTLKLGPVYTIDHEVGPGLYKAVDWLLKLS